MPAQTANQIKMKRLRDMRKPKGKKGGCADKSKCMCGCGKKAMCGEGKKLAAIAAAARKAAKAAAAATRKAAAFAQKHRKAIAEGVSTAATLGSAITGNETLGAIGSVASSLGEGKRGRGQSGRGLPVVGGTTGELQMASYIHYPNSASPFTGRLVF